MRARRTALVLVYTASLLAAQDDPGPSARDAWLALNRSWAEAKSPPPVARRIEDLEGLLRTHREGPWAALAWSHLGGLHLRELSAAAAEEAFTAALNLTSDEELDIYGRAIYGLAQSQEMQGQRAAAIASLQRIDRSFLGTRYHRYAQVALQRLAVAHPDPRPGKPMPPLRLGADVRTGSPPPRLDAPWLLAFFHSEHPATIDAVERLQKVWDPAVRPMIAIDLSGQRDRCAEVTRERSWACHTICADDGFLHPDALQLGVATTPTWFVSDRDGRLLARDIPAPRLASLLR